jgi:hypothetical protein
VDPVEELVSEPLQWVVLIVDKGCCPALAGISSVCSSDIDPSVGEVFEDERLFHARCVHPFIGEVLPLVVLQVGKK